MWRPKNWENHYAFMTGGAIPTYENQYQAFEAGADAMLELLKREGKYIDASKYPYGMVLNEIPPIQKLTRRFKGYVIIVPDEEEK